MFESWAKPRKGRVCFSNREFGILWSADASQFLLYDELGFRYSILILFERWKQTFQKWRLEINFGRHLQINKVTYAFTDISVRLSWNSTKVKALSKRTDQLIKSIKFDLWRIWVVTWSIVAPVPFIIDELLLAR